MVNTPPGKTKDGVKVVDTLIKSNETLYYDEYTFYTLFLLSFIILENFE
jgi:hypothetical protein